MNFLHPAMLFAAAAIALPLLIHWLTRPRPVRLPLSTIRFVLMAVQQKKARNRLRDFLVLALRCLAVALLVYAFARPLGGVQPPASTPGDSAQGVRIVVLDTSASMGALTQGVSLFEKARPLAGQALNDAGGMRLNVIFAGAVPRAAFDGAGLSIGALREELGKAQPRPEKLSAQAAINMAATMLNASAPDHRRELVVISDFQRTNWTTIDFSPLPKDTKIELKSVGEGQRANIGILRVAEQGRAEQGRELRIEIEVGNYSATARQVNVELTIGKAIQRLSELCPPGMGTTMVATIVPTEPGWQEGEVRLLDAEDSLRADDRRALVLNVRPSPTFLLVTRESEKPRATSSHFVERALAPTAAAHSTAKAQTRVVRVATAQFDREAAAADLIVLDHPGRLSAESVNLLLSVLRRGRPVLYIVSESTDATNLKMLAEAAGSQMNMPVEFLPPKAGERRRGLFLAEVSKDEQPFSVFGESLASVTGPMRFGGGLPSRRLESGLADDVLATFSDRSAAVVVTSCGAGMLGVINADLAESTLPSSTAFVPLMSELVLRLMGSAVSQSNVNSGEMLAVYLPPEAGAVEGLVLEPADTSGELVEERAMVAWRWQAAGEPGAYRVRRGDATVFAVATSVPAIESDLRAADGGVMKRLAGGRELTFTGATADGSDETDSVWAWVMAVCVMCMMMELAVLMVFGT